MDSIIDSQLPNRPPEKFKIGEAESIRFAAIRENTILLKSQKMEVRRAYY